MSVTKDQVMEQLKTVMIPELGKHLVALNMIKNIALCDGLARVTVELPAPAAPMKDKISFDVKKAVTLIDGISVCEVEVTVQAQPSPQEQAQKSNPLP
ncbi:iron-sulfur cluster assembly protein, partial [bacterium AH-315-I18]|nr:iron-sulfur cluster assembly protein [bacterium AH-315-I18]